MTEYEVVPLEGIGEVRLGMNRKEVRKIMGENPETSGSRGQVDNYHQNGFQVFYTEEDTVEFIELLRESGFRATARGVNIFDTTAKEVLHLIARYSDYNQDDLELGYSYVFPDIELSLWRPSIPESDDDEEGKYFSTVGIGTRGYYSATTKS
jgi:hypothetical protein